MAIDETFRVNPRTPGRQDTLDVVPRAERSPRRRSSCHAATTGRCSRSNRRRVSALSVQYTGFSPTAELDAFRRFGLARNIDDFRDALQYFDIGRRTSSTPTSRATSRTSPTPRCRSGRTCRPGRSTGTRRTCCATGPAATSGSRSSNPQPNQSVPYEIVPFRELPKVVNPQAGFVVSANNDPTANSFDNNVLNQVRPGRRHLLPRLRPQRVPGRPHHRHGAGRHRQGPDHRRRRGEMQADMTTRRAVLHSDHRERAGPRRRSSTPELAALVKDPRIVEAVGRLAGGISDLPDRHPARDTTPPTATASSASRRSRRSTTAWPPRSTLCGAAGSPSTWSTGTCRRSRRRCRCPETRDAGRRSGSCCSTSTPAGAWAAPGIDFFAVPGIADAADRRDFLVLKSVATRSPGGRRQLHAAFGNSTDQSDYRWGKLHRITLTSPLGAPYTIPSQGNRFTSPLPGLPGIPVDGGPNVPDVGRPSAAGRHAGRSSSSRSCRTAGSWPRRPGRLAVGELRARVPARTSAASSSRTCSAAGSPTTRIRSGCTPATRSVPSTR